MNGEMLFQRFSLTLMVTRNCTLRCDYCYAGRKGCSRLSEEFGRRAIDRALASMADGAALDLSFFGGEPLLEPERIELLIDHAETHARPRRVRVSPGLTTNGTLWQGAAWRLMTRPGMRVAVSHDGIPELHDRHRPFADGRASSGVVLRTLRALAEAGVRPRVVSVVRPDTVGCLAAGIEFLHESCGARRFDPTLDLWTRWTAGDVVRLEEAVERLAEFWRGHLPESSISWLDEKAARLMGVPCGPTARCGFGRGELAVATSGRLYPCERLIGEDEAESPARLPGHVCDTGRFPVFLPPPVERPEACERCRVASLCDVSCRCSNYLRTGDAGRPDGLLCRWNRACIRAVGRVLAAAPAPSPVHAA
jgi:uncharacterized protein